MVDLRITACRLCGGEDLKRAFDLGKMHFSGIFPATHDEDVPKGDLQVVRCSDCGLAQLAHSFDLEVMYGPTYGYRSGLNHSMVAHLDRKAKWLADIADAEPGDVVLDIGSSDGTLLRGYSPGFTLVGVDPQADRFAEFYPEGATRLAGFFSEAVRTQGLHCKRPKIITTIAMFYDLPDPAGFAKDIRCMMNPAGIWHLEQSYLPAMLQAGAYDTICHEHLEYYGLKQIKWIMDKAGLRIIDVGFNQVNGGSFHVTVAREDHPAPSLPRGA